MLSRSLYAGTTTERLTSNPLLGLPIEPLDESGKTVANACSRIVSQQGSRFRDVCARPHDVARLRRQPVDLDPPAELVFQFAYQFREGDGLRVSKIENFEGKRIV